MEIDTRNAEGEVLLIGDVVRDPITNLQGTIVGITQWTTGCARASVQPALSDKGRDQGQKPPDAWSIDTLTLHLVKAGPRHTKQPDPELVGAGKGGPATIVEHSDRGMTVR